MPCHTEITVPQCGNYRNLITHFSDKNFVNAMFSLKKGKKVQKSWFYEMFFQWEIFFGFPHCGYHFRFYMNRYFTFKLEIHCGKTKFSLTEKIFREIIFLVSSSVKTLLSRNFCQTAFKKKILNCVNIALTNNMVSFIGDEEVEKRRKCFSWNHGNFTKNFTKFFTWSNCDFSKSPPS